MPNAKQKRPGRHQHPKTGRRYVSKEVVDAVARRLDGCLLTIRELVETTEFSAPQVGGALRRLKAKKKVGRRTAGRPGPAPHVWRLPASLKYGAKQQVTAGIYDEVTPVEAAP